MERFILIAVLMAALTGTAAAQGDGAFQSAVRSYVDARRAAAGDVSTSPGDSTVPELVRQNMARRIQSAREDASAGDLLGAVASQIREIVRRETAGPQGAAVLASIERSNVYSVRPRVNHRYPPGLPRVTMPGTLLAKLPALPSELEYRFLGRSLILVDTDAGLVVDMIPDVLPPPSARASSDT